MDIHGPASSLPRRPSQRSGTAGEPQSVAVAPLNENELASLPTASCVKIWAVGAEPSYLLPWQVSEQSEWTGSGFAVLVGGQWRLLTNAHVVDAALVVRVTRQSETRKVGAQILHIAHDLDLALLDVNDSSFKEMVPTVEFLETLPLLFSEVKAIGYPEGGTTISVTRGVVSRVDAQLYAHAAAKGILPWSYNNPGRLVIVQVDAAINAGNSGGPAVNQNGKVIGVASSSLDEAQNIGYIIPAALVQNFLSEVLNVGHWSGVPEPGFTFRHLESDALREFLQMPSGRTGVQLTSIAPLGALGPHVSRGEVVLQIDGQAVSNEGSILLKRGNGQDVQLPLEHLITSKRRGQRTTLLMLRSGGREEEICVEFTPIPPLLPRFNGYDAQPSFFIFGGLVFTRLSTPLFNEYLQTVAVAEEAVLSVPEAVLEKNRSWREQKEEIVILMRVLKHSVNEGIQSSSVRILECVNGETVQSLEDLVRLSMLALNSGQRFVRLGFLRHARESGGNDVVEVLRTNDILAADEEILVQHQVPAPVSPDLERTYRAHAPSHLDFVAGWLSCLRSLAGCRKKPRPVDDACDGT